MQVEMPEPIAWFVQFRVRPGMLERFQALVGRMVEISLADAGTIAYEWFVSGDGALVSMYERYTDVSAAHRHMRAAREEFIPYLAELVDVVSVTVLGTPDDELRELLAPFPVTFNTRFAGFSR